MAGQGSALNVMELSTKAIDSQAADLSGGNSLTAVMIPLTERETGQLDVLFFLWGLYAIADGALGKAAQADVGLIISLDGQRSQKLEDDIAQAFGHYGLHRIFRGLGVHFCEMTPEENIYVRMGQEPPDHIPPLGLKSGPNTQFFRSLSKFCGGQKTVLLNEADCFPERGDWLERMKLLVSGSESFWVMGSPYRGSTRLGPKILAHVNGNALYGVGMPGFAEFLQGWEASLREELKQKPDLAYDEYLPYRHSALFDPQLWHTVPPEMFKLVQTLLCKVRYTSLIHNLAGTEEMSGKARIVVDTYIKQHTETTLMHGRFMKPQILQKALETSRLLANQLPALRSPMKNYLISASKRLLGNGNLDASKIIVRSIQ